MSDITIQQVIEQRAATRKAIKDTMDAAAASCAPLQVALEACNQYILSDLPNLNAEEIMRLRFDAIEDSAIIAGSHSAALAPYTAEELACSTRIKEMMIKDGVQQLKTSAGETHFTTKDSVQVEDMDEAIGFMLAASPPPDAMNDWETILQHIKATGMWGLLTKALHKSNVKSVLEGGVAPDKLGVKYTTFRDLVWKRGKS